MKCARCQAENREGRRFCAECGAPLSLACPACGFANEPGVGKSRLYWEFIHSHRTHGWLVLESGSASYGKATPYLPVIDLLRAYFQSEPRDEPRKLREKVTGKLLSLDRALEPALSALLSLLDVPPEDPQWERLDPPQRRQRTLDGVKRLLLRESHLQPLLVMFEDLHWIDAETQALLDSLVESLPTARLLLLVNYRPEYQHAWGGKTYYRQLRIDPLPPESADELLRALLGQDPGLQPLKQLLIDQTQGNPFFLEESVQTLVETRVLVGERGAYRLATTPPSIQVPATVQAVLAARIDRLPPEEKRLLQAAAVIGEEVPLALLQAIDLRFDLRTSLFPLGELERLIGYLREAEGLARTLDDQRRLGWVSIYMGHLLWSTGHSTDALTFVQSAQAIAQTLQDFRLQVGANFYAAWCVR